MADRDIGSTLLRRVIGREFAKIRKRAGLTMDQAADKLDRSRGTLHRIETGADTVRYRKPDVEQMLRLYKANDEESELLLAMTAETRNGKSRWHDYTSTALPRWFALYVGLEESAEVIRTYEAEVVPGLLQTRAYAEQVCRLPADYLTDEEEIQRRVEVRLERQSVLTKPRAPHLHFILSEAVIRRAAGSNDVMAEQLRHLLKVADQPNVTVRIVPFAAGLHAGAVASAFAILDFPTDEAGQPMEPPVTYVDTLTGAMYLDKAPETEAYNLVWQDLHERSLDETASRDLITHVAEEYSRD